ncbi:MAG TPA: MFS transporter [Verrucomicrobiota bacterium]|nr:MFS transporter [Verrucomicrobiota bacterium]
MNEAARPDQRLVRWQWRIFWLLWGGYAAYYLCRVNFAVAQPLLLKAFPDWTNAQVGAIPSVYAIFYAIGQLVNGTLGQRYGTRRMMTGALLCAAITNLLFSAADSYGVMLALWALNGYGQSAGWSLLVQTVANWNTSRRRGTVIGLISTCYTVGNVLSWLLAGTLCDAYGWRAAFLVPGLLVLPWIAVFATFLRDTPEEVGFPTVRDDVGAAGQPAGPGTPHSAPAGDGGWAATWAVLRLTLANRILWILAIGFFCMNAVRYSFMNWSIQYMAEFHGRSIKGSALIAVAIPLVGSLGAISAGWISDHWFGRRRAPVCALMQIGLAAVCVGFAFLPRGAWQIATAVLALAGFLIYGPDMLMSGAATIDISHPRAGAIATGFTMCFGALGSIFSGAGIGWIKDFTGGEWGLTFFVLAGLVLVSASLMISIWNARPKGSA